MEADGAAQRAECRRLVSTAVRRAGWLVDEVLQVSLNSTLSEHSEHSCAKQSPHTLLQRCLHRGQCQLPLQESRKPAASEE